MAKINIDKFICDYYEEKKKKLPYGVWSGKLDMIERLLRIQNLEIHDGELKEINEGKPKFKVGQYVIYKNEYFYIYNVENGYYFLVGTGEITHVELPVEHEGELTLILDNALVSARIGTNIVPQDSFGGLLNELFMDFPKVPFSDMLRIVLCTQEYIESQQPKQALPKWRKTYNKSNWSGEISVSPMERLFRYENYTINADELFNKLEKE